MTNTMAIQEPLRLFLRELRIHELVSPTELEIGLTHIESELSRVMLDAHTAMVKKVPWSKAATDFENYPFLSQLHTAIDDILTLTLPPELFEWAVSFIGSPEPQSFEKMRLGLVAAAADGSSPYIQALARFGLFEAVRLNLVIMNRLFPAETTGVGIDVAEINDIAEKRVNEWLSTEPVLPEGVRPLETIVAVALKTLETRVEELKTGLACIRNSLAKALEDRARIEAMLNEMDTVDAVLIRNAMAPRLEEQRFSVDELKRRHKFALDAHSRNTLDQRFRRSLKKNLAQLKRKGPALLDIIKDGI